MRVENKVDMGGDVRMRERGHKSRYGRKHMEGNVVEMGLKMVLGGGTVCWEVLQSMGDPHWGRDTPKGLQHVEDLGWRRGGISQKEGAEKENSKK